MVDMTDDASISSSNAPPEQVYTAYSANDPIYSIYNNDYGMDLAWNYIPSDLDGDINFTRDYVLSTGQHCNNFFNFGSYRNFLRDLATVRSIDKLSFHVKGPVITKENALAVNLISSLDLSPYYVAAWDPDQYQSMDDKLIYNLGSSTPKITNLIVSNSRPKNFACFVNYTDVFRDNSLLDFNDFLSKRLNSIYQIAEEQMFFSTFFGSTNIHLDPVRSFAELARIRDNGTTAFVPPPSLPKSMVRFIDFTGASGVFADATGYTYKFIVDLVSISLHQKYMKNTSLIMRPSMYTRLRALAGDWGPVRRDDGQLLLCNTPVFLSQYMGSSRILFGDFKQALMIVDYGQPQILDIPDSERKALTGQNPPYVYHDAKFLAKMFRHRMNYVIFDSNAMVLVDEAPLQQLSVDSQSFSDTSDTEEPQVSSFSVQPETASDNDSRRRRRSRDQ
jgi:hypothetical protein